MMAGFSADKEMPDFMVGSCLTMCPSAEVRLRQTEGLLHSLEKAVNANGVKMNYGNPRFMVKEFSRSAAGHEIKPSDIRPLPVLAKTVKFLLTSSCCREDVSWALIYQFVSDRLRAVRQDLCVQGVKNLDCIKIHLASVRFHVYSHYRMCEHELADFDPYLNKKMLLETLTLILALYRDLDKEAPETREECPEPQQFESDGNWTEEESEEGEEKITKDSQTSEKNSKEETTAAGLGTKLEDLELRERDGEGVESESIVPGHSSQTDQANAESESGKIDKSIESYSSREEAEAFYIIVNFGSEDALSHALTLPKHIRCSPLVSLVLEMSTSWLTHNYSRVIHLSTFLPPLFLCAFHPHMAEVERKALSILSRSHSCKGQVYKKDDLAKLLFFSDYKNMQKACEHYGIDLKESGAIFIKSSFKVDAPLRKVTRLEWIEERLNKVPLSELLVPQDLQDADISSLPDHEFEEDPLLLPPEVMLTHGCGTTDEACSEKDDMQDLAGDEPERCIGSVVHPEPAEVSTELPIDTGESVPDQDYVDKLLLQSYDKKCGAVQEHKEETCTEPYGSELLSSKVPVNKDCTNRGNEGILKEIPEILEQNNSISFSLEQSNLNGSIQLSGKTSLASEDSGVSCDSVDQMLCDSASYQDSSILPNEILKDVSENSLGDSPSNRKNGCSHQTPVSSCSVPEAVLLEESALQKSSVNETYLSSSHEPSKDDTPVELMNKNSGISSPETGKTGLRQRKNLEKKEAIAKKVQKMKEKQIASEDWIKKKQLICKPLTITLGILSLGVIGLLLYQNFNP